MQKYELAFPTEDRLKTLLTKDCVDARQHEVGTAFLPAGSRMPDAGKTTHRRHEVSIILEGAIETSSEGESFLLKAGDIISIPTGEAQSTRVIEDTRLIYIFFDD